MAMTPYYEQSGITIYHADCRDVLPTLESGSVDLVVTSPPFNAGMEYEEGAWQTLEEYRDWLNGCMAALWPVCASGAWVTCELQDLHVSPEHSHHLPKQKEQFCMATCAHLTVAMDRAGRMACAPGSPALLVQHSRILFFRKPGGRTGVYQFPEQSNEWKARWCRSVWTHVHPASHEEHPAVFPRTLPFGLMEGWSLPNSLVLDPFMGSGTTLAAAKMLGRNAIGIEKEERYCEIAARRLEQSVLPLEVSA